MPSIHFDITADNDEALGKFREMTSSILSTTKAAENSGSKIEDVLDHLSVVADGMLAELQKTTGKLGSTIDSAKSTFNDASDEIRKKYSEAMQEMKNNTTDLESTVQGAAGSIKNGFMQALGFAGVDFLQSGLGEVFNKVFETRSYFQDINSSMEVFLGNADKAAEFTSKLKDYAFYNAFEFSDLAQASQQLIAYRNDIEDVIPIIDKLSNIAVGTQGNLVDLVSVYNKAKSTGVVDSNGLAAWATRGVVVKDILKDMGENASNTTISFEQLNKALDYVTSEGQMFHDLQGNMMDNISMSKGQLEDDITAMFDDLGNAIMPALKNIIESGDNVVSTLDNMIQACQPFFDVLNNATQNLVDNFGDVEQELQRPLNALNSLITSNTGDIGLFGNAMEGLATHLGDFLHILQDLAVAYGAYRVALILTSGVQKALLTIEEQELIVKAGINEKVKAGIITQEIANATDTKTIAIKTLLTGALKKYTVAALEATAATLTNPYVLMGAALVALSVAVYECATAEDAYTEATKSLNNVHEQTKKDSDERIEQAKAEKKVIEDSTKSTYDKAEALKALKKTYDSLKGYSLEDIEKMSDTQFNSLINENEETKKLEILKSEIDALKEINDFYTSGKEGLIKDAISNESYETFKKYLDQRSWTQELFGDSRSEYFSVLLDKAESEFYAFQDRLDEANKPKEVLIQEAKENVTNKQEIFDFYDKYMKLVNDLDEKKEKFANSPIMSDAVMKETDDNFNELIANMDKRIEELREDAKRDPLRFQTQLEDLEKVRNQIISQKDTWKSEGTLTIPLLFTADMKSAEQALNTAKTNLGVFTGEEGKDKDKTTQNKEYWKKLKDQAQGELDALESTSKTFDKDASALKKRIAEYDKELKKYSTSSKTTKNEAKNKAREQQAYNDLVKKQTEERIRKDKDSELAIEQNRINMMEESSAKTRRQIELDFKKEEESIKRAYEDLKKTKLANARALWEKDPRNKSAIEKGAVFDEKTVDLSLTQNEIIERLNRITANQVKYNRAMDDLRKKDLQSANEYYTKYGTIEEQRAAIISKYDELIKSTTDEYQKAAYALEKDDALEKLSEKDIFGDIDWDGIFGDLEGHTEQYLVGLRDSLRELLDSNKLSDIADIEKVQQKIHELNAQIAKEGGLFSFNGEYQQERQRLRDNRDNAQRNLNNAIGEYAKAGIVLEVLDSQGVDKNSAKYKKAEADLEKARLKVTDATIKATKAEDALTQTLADKIVGIFKTIEESKVFENLEGLPDMFNQLGLGSVGERVQKGLTGFNDASGAAADFANQNYIGALTKGLSAIQDFGEALGIGGDSDKTYAEDMERLTLSNENLRKSIDSLESAINDADTKEAIKNYKLLFNNIRQQEANTQEQLRRSGDASSKGFLGFGSAGSSNRYINESVTTSEWNKISKLLGVTVRSAQDFWNLTSKQMWEVATYETDIYTKIKQHADDGKEDAAQYMDEYIGYWEELKQKEMEYANYLTGISFDSMKSEFKSTLMDMNSEVDDFADSLTKKVTEAILEMALKVNNGVYDQMQKMQKELSDTFEKANGDFEKVDSNWLDDWMVRYQKIYNSGQDLAQKVFNVTGYGEDASQSATANGIKGITADKYDQIVGRITAMQIAVEANRNDTSSQFVNCVNNLISLNNVALLNNQALGDILSQQVLANSFLESIERYNKNMYGEWTDKMDAMINYLQRI